MPQIEWSTMKARDIQALQQENAMVIVPIGSLEQHGPHLPVHVDALLAGEVARRVAIKVTATHPILVTPTVWCGLAEHHMSFGGTITLDFATFQGLLKCICQSLIRQGFHQILLLNGHGGNIAALSVISDILTLELDCPIAATSYWLPAAEAFDGVLEQQTSMGHACEAETSMLLAVAPELVDVDAMLHARGPANGLFDASGIHVWRSTAHWSKTGIVGTPSAATAEKGVLLLEAAVSAIAKQLLRGDIWNSNCGPDE